MAWRPILVALLAITLLAACRDDGGPAPITAARAPTIATQPQSRAVRIGSPASFSVIATGSAPFAYQWLRDGAAIPGAQQATFTLTTTVTSDNGAMFSAVVTNAAGSVTSAAAALTVTPEPSLSLLAGNIGGSGSIDGIGARARFTQPSGVAVDGSGNAFVADGNAIRKVSPTGVVTTFAGSATAGSNDGVGTSASFSGIGGIVIDAAGNLFVADGGNDTIRRITASGDVTTLAGSAGNVGLTNGIGVAARFSNPGAVAADGFGSLYVADLGNGRIRKIAPGGIVTTVPGAFFVTSPFAGPGIGGLVADMQGNLYIAATFTIDRIDATGIGTRIAGSPIPPPTVDGPDGVANFFGPSGMVLDDGDVIVADSQAIRRVTLAGAVMTFAGKLGVPGAADGIGTAASFSQPAAIARDASGVLFVADRDNYTLRRIDAGAVVSTVAGAPIVQGSTDGVGAAAAFNGPIGIASDVAGNIFVSDTVNATIRKIARDGRTSTLAGLAGSTGTADGSGTAARFMSPRGIATDAAGNVYVADHDSHTIRKVSAAGTVTTIAGTAGVAGAANGIGVAATFTYPDAVAVDVAGNVFVTEGFTATIRRITPAGVVTTVARTTFPESTVVPVAPEFFSSPKGIVADAAGNLFFADADNATVRRVAIDGTVTTVAGIAGQRGALDGPSMTATFTAPTGIAIDGAGNLYVSDPLTRSIRRIDVAGTVSTIVGVADGLRGVALGPLPGHLDSPMQLAIDPAGFLYCTDANGVIRIVLP